MDAAGQRGFRVFYSNINNLYLRFARLSSLPCRLIFSHQLHLYRRVEEAKIAAR